MAAEELFKRYLEIGASLLGMSRERAESIVGDLVSSGEVAKEQATRAADWLVERGRTGREELAELVRREIRQQVTAMGLATREDIARLEARIEGTDAAPAAEAAAAPPRAAAAGRKAKAGPAGPPATGAWGAGITRSGSVKGRAAPPGTPPPAGEAVPPKG